jgi:hypothetical protein
LSSSSFSYNDAQLFCVLEKRKGNHVNLQRSQEWDVRMLAIE